MCLVVTSSPFCFCPFPSPSIVPIDYHFHSFDTILAVVSNGSDHYVSRNSGDYFVSKLMLACPQCIHFKSSNLPDVVPVARFSRGDVNMPNCNVFPIDDLVSEVKFEAAVCDWMPVSWLLASSTTVSRYSMYLSDLMFLMILLVVGCSCLKSQRERIIYGMNSAPKRRYVHIHSLIGYSF